MKRHLLTVLILLAALMHTISYASDDTDHEEKTFIYPEPPDTPPRIIKAAVPRNPLIRTVNGLINAEGRVIVKFIVTKDGSVRDPVVVKAVPEGLFEEVALEAAKQYKFSPATKDGKPVETFVNLPIKFGQPGVNTSLDAYEAAQKGLKFITVGEYDNAVRAFSEAINISKTYSPGYSGRGIAYIHLKEYEKAIEDFDAAIKRSRKTALNYKLRGDAYSSLKNYKKAIQDYDRAVKIEPEMPEAYFERGNAFRSLGKYSEAVADYTMVIELDKSCLQAYNNRAAAYNKLKDPENMCLDIKKACDLGDCRGWELAQNAGKCSADVVEN